MATSNKSTKLPPVYTHEGAVGVRSNNPLAELKRRTLTCMLFEDTFYEKGSTIASEMARLIPDCNPEDVAALASEARNKMYLRHVPLFLVRELARKKGNGAIVRKALNAVIQRPDEITEYLAIYWRDRIPGSKREPISNASRRGLADAFRKFNRYSLSKYREEGKTISLKDALCLVRPKALNVEQNTLWKELRAGTLRSENTWEVELAAGKDKKETFERLLREKKLGALAFIRNLRNMENANVEPSLIRERFAGKLDKVLPFRFVTAARYSPTYASELSDAMLRVTADMPKLTGHTCILVDVSGSMNDKLSAKSETTRMDAAAGMAVLYREVCEHCEIFTFSNHLVQVTGYRGLPLVRGILDSQPHSSTYLGRALAALPRNYDRIVVITDEQAHDVINVPAVEKGYIVNVAPYSIGVKANGNWTRIDGWSERLLDWMFEYER